jgi:hypothetical protein
MRETDMLAADSNHTITEVTRRAIIDYLSVGSHWSGVLAEHEFLGRLYPLTTMPSTDYRREFNNASLDIWKHRVMNSDWSEDWVFTDTRFDLLFGPDEPFLKFLAETVHPVVRNEASAAWKIVNEYNSHLAVDGWELYVSKKISEKPIFAYRLIADGAKGQLAQVKAVADRLSGQYVVQQIRRLEDAVERDPELAIGTSKEFLETLCKTILTERQVPFGQDDDFPKLVRTTIKALTLVPTNLEQSATAEKIVMVLLNNLGSISNQLAELRNLFGTGHGKLTDHVGLQKRHAKLAVGAAATLALFLFESHDSGGGEDVKATITLPTTSLLELD